MADKQSVLLQVFKNLPQNHQETLIKFAQFLAQNSESKPEKSEPSKPEDILRPKDETVIGAIKRLRATYPMINPDSMMDSISVQMSAHLIKGQNKKLTIDKLEKIFQTWYKEKI
jgi:hypothetical protein